MVPLKDYYEDEIRYFINESQKFAAKHPKQAHALNLTDVRERDPYAERLIEAFAFLTGSISKRIDDDFSMMASDLLSVIWPHYLYPLPSSVILCMNPVKGLIQSGKTIKKGSCVESGNLSTGLRSRFTTCTDCLIRPFEIENASLISLRGGQSAIRLTLHFFAESKWENMDLSPLLLYLHGDPGVASILYYILLKDVHEVTIRWNDGNDEIPLPATIIQPAGLSPEPENALLPFPDHSFAGFSMLETYFYFSERYRFVTVDMFKAMSEVEPDSRCEIDFILSGSENWRIKLTPNHFKLNCVPAINLYTVDADPITLDTGKMSYRMMVNKAESLHCIPYQVEKVSGIRVKDGSRHQYQSFYSYRFDMNTDQPTYYYLKHAYNVEDKPELYLSIVRPDNAGKEVLSIELLCGNDPVIREVQTGDIRFPYDLPDFVRPINLSAPTIPVWPVLEGKELWTLIHSLGLNFNSINTQERLHRLLSMYNRSEDRANYRRIDGIKAYTFNTKHSIYNGYPVNAISVHLAMVAEHFINKGDMLMFSYILAKFFSMYVPINTICELSVIDYETNRPFVMQRETGGQAII
ncbi:type VI secretion system protein ImpG [Candidatus Magnetomorum sp. HK-1]|nr:type VI secretion system protein ImpG [Candidatus Magnetomorum sp. HK-1]